MVGFAQEQTDSSAVAQISSLSILADLDSSTVFLNGDSIGVTPLRGLALVPGSYRIKIVPRDATNWLLAPILDSLNLQPSSSKALTYVFTKKLLIISKPSSANVFLEDSLIGATPLVVSNQIPGLTLRREGFEDAPADITEARRGIVSIDLKKVWRNEGEQSIFSDARRERSPLRLYITGATTILAGAASAYFKVKADNSFRDYARTGDPSRLSEVDRLDTSAGIALAVTQISLGLFTYFILTE